MVEVTAYASAKLNLALRVGRRRADGFHPLKTLFHAVDLLESVTVTPAKRDRIEVAGLGAEDVPTDSSNLVAQATELLRRMTGRRVPVRIRLNKAVPTAAGLAGGSADAAAALIALNQLWSLGLLPRQLHDLAAALGSDVPFALHGGTAIGHGRGETLTPVRAGSRLYWALVTTPAGMSTPDVFERFDQMVERSALEAPPPIPTGLVDAVRRGDPQAVGRYLINDLQAAILALRPDLSNVLATANRIGALGAVISGSGPTVACLAPGPQSAAKLAETLGAALPNNKILLAAGPAPGARLAV
jgi:4-diphosphocytidyl-2-C-methyl-D-erythritol kinase